MYIKQRKTQTTHKRIAYLKNKLEKPHGYEYYLIVEGDLTPHGAMATGDVPEGLCAVMEIKTNLHILTFTSSE